MALGLGELIGLAELIGLEMGATELLADGTAPTARSAGFTVGAGLVEAGVGLVTVPGGTTADDGLGLGVGDAVAVAGGKPSFTLSLRLLRALPLWA